MSIETWRSVKRDRDIGRNCRVKRRQNIQPSRVPPP